MKSLLSTRIFAWSVFTAVFIGCSGCNTESNEPKQQAGKSGSAPPSAITAVSTFTVDGQPYEETVELPGASIRGFETTQLMGNRGGYVKTIGNIGGEEIDIGSSVEQGDILAILDVPEIKDLLAEKDALVKQAESKVTQAVAGIKQADSERIERNAEVKQAEAKLDEKKALLQLQTTRYNNIAKLVEKGDVAGDNLDEAKFALDAAESALTSGRADITTAKARVTAAEANIAKALADKESAEAEVKVAEAVLALEKTLAEYATIKAPFKGVITKRLIDRGAFVQPATSNSGATPLFEITSIDKIRVAVSVPSTKSASIRVGQKAVLRSIGGLPGVTLEGEVSRSARALDSESRMMPIEIHFDNPIHDPKTGKTIRLRPGMYGSIRVVVNFWDEANPLPVVPSTAVAYDADNQPYVMLVKNRTCEKTIVEVLVFKDAQNVGIRSGLNIGDVVVSEGITDLEDGQEISANSP